MGAGRIRKDHTLLHRLLDEEGLKVIPIGTEIGFKVGTGPIEPNPFESV